MCAQMPQDCSQQVCIPITGKAQLMILVVYVVPARKLALRARASQRAPGGRPRTAGKTVSLGEVRGAAAGQMQAVDDVTNLLQSAIRNWGGAESC